MDLIKYKTLKPAMHAQRAPQVLDRDFNYAEVLMFIACMFIAYIFIAYIFIAYIFSNMLIASVC